MRRSAIARVAAVICATLVLAGCVRSMPVGVSDAELQAFNQKILDGSWLATGLDGIEPRPVVALEELRPDQDWTSALSGCLDSNGYGEVLSTFGLGYSDSALSLILDGASAENDPALQLAFYRCVAAHPVYELEGLRPYSQDELNYIYDYYRDWLVPCLMGQGYDLAPSPSRAAFLVGNGEWSPFWSIEVPPGPDGRFEAITEACGPERPPLD